MLKVLTYFVLEVLHALYSSTSTVSSTTNIIIIDINNGQYVCRTSSPIVYTTSLIRKISITNCREVMFSSSFEIYESPLNTPPDPPPCQSPVCP